VTTDDYYARPTLTGQHVRLEQLEPRHAEGVLGASDDDEVRAQDAGDRAGPGCRPRCLHRRILRSARVNPVTFNPCSTWLARRFWRTGVNTEAKLLLLRHAFDSLRCARVVWHVDIFNERSQAAVVRIGGVREGVLRKHKIRRDGSWRDTVLFSMTDDEWPAARVALERRLARAR